MKGEEERGREGGTEGEGEREGGREGREEGREGGEEGRMFQMPVLAKIVNYRVPTLQPCLHAVLHIQQ